MNELTFNEIQLVSGGELVCSYNDNGEKVCNYEIKPSAWMYTGAGSTAFAAACVVVTAFSSHPLPIALTLVRGSAIGISFNAAYDILRAYDL